ncbi:MotA/TolQ/ExbB proton channel family protein [uncultured Imperialibacter sp.]|uniref:MotA/TolQ/ExbB proton channel family protein n=1 Tax=uncultured Imperialibacter sp. TaxID=1672639 RepID=UPI0030DC78DF|tara:strand:- start:16620 stop:17705 length:1086 start_codon:yes stop_codon:yes gene_type:complete
MEFLLTELPWFLLIGWTVYSVMVCLNFSAALRSKMTNFYVFESIPQIFITLGLLGTFMGIAYGLINFDTSPDLIKDSIGDLLDGLKTAFYTSIYGIVLNLIFGNIVKYKMHAGHAREPEFESEMAELNKMNDHLASLSANLANSIDNAIVESLKGVVDDVNNTFKSFIDQLIEKNFDRLTESIDRLTTWQEEYFDEIQSIKNAYQQLVERHQTFVATTQNWVDTLDEIAGQTSHLAAIIEEFKAITDDESRFSEIIYQVKDSASNMKDASQALVKHADSLGEVKDAFIESKDEISLWLEREDGVRDSVNALSHSLQELKKFEISSLNKLDDKFMDNLNATFQGLDNVMKEYIIYLESKFKK